MKVLHTISGLSVSSGGPTRSVYSLVKELRKRKINAEIFSQVSSNNLEVISKENFITFVKSKNNLDLFSSSFKKQLNLTKSPDIYHGHGLWQLPIHYMAREARKKNIPYIISPRGMLEPWSLRQKKIKKKIALALYQYKDLSNAACLHATSFMEADNIRKLSLKNTIAVIPNGINISEFSLKNFCMKNETKTVLFLSRIHHKKGIELLIEAWYKLDKTLRNGWNIEIVGNGDENYIEKLNHIIKEKKLNDEIKIVGPKFGKDKIEAYRKSDIFVLPTYSENFGMVIAEALAFGLPVITTKGAPWEELNTHNAGWWIDIGVEPLANALREALKLSDEERKQMGLNGRKLVEEKYSIDIVANKMIQLYEWILGKNKKPDFIYE
jgi:glycosyltransferase involved in cell wall biosynthesis